MLKAYTALQEDKAAMELTLHTKLKRLETVKEQEKAVLRARVDRLSRLQEEAINAGGAQKTRALLWHAALKSKTQAEDSISWRGENSPALSDAPRWKAQQWAEQQFAEKQFAEQQWAESASGTAPHVASSSTSYDPEDAPAAAAAASAAAAVMLPGRRSEVSGDPGRQERGGVAFSEVSGDPGRQERGGGAFSEVSGDPGRQERGGGVLESAPVEVERTPRGNRR